MTLANVAHAEMVFIPPDTREWQVQTGQLEGSPPVNREGGYTSQFDPQMRYNGAPPVYEGPATEYPPYGSEEPVRVIDRNGEEMAVFPPGTKLFRVNDKQPFLDEQYSSHPDSPYAILRRSFVDYSDGTEAGVFRVELPPTRLREGDRLLVQSNPQYLIVSVDKRQFAGRENIPFPDADVWTDEEIDALRKPEDSKYPIYFDLIRSGDYFYVVKSLPFFIEDGSVEYRAQTAFWDTEHDMWVLLREGGLESGSLTTFSNGAVLIDGVKVDSFDQSGSNRLFRAVYLYQPNSEVPGFTLIRKWQLNQELPADFVVSPDGKNLLVVDTDLERYDHDRHTDGREDRRSVYISPGSEPSDNVSLKEKTEFRSEFTKIAELPVDFDRHPRISVSPDGNTVAVVSQYSGQFNREVDGKEVIADVHTIHDKQNDDPIVATMLTVVKKGADGKWYPHYVALPEGWAMAGRYLLSWESDGGLRISQYDSSLPEDQRWSHHFVNTSTLETGVLPYETFFITDPKSIRFQNEQLSFVDSNGVARVFIVGYQPDDGRLERWRSNLRLAQEGMSMWITYDSRAETMQHGISDYTLGFAGDWISGKPDPLVGVKYEGGEVQDEMSRIERAKVERQKKNRRLFGYFE